MISLIKNTGLILFLLVPSLLYSHDAKKIEKLVASNILGTVSSLVAPPHISAVISLVPYLNSDNNSDNNNSQNKYLTENKKLINNNPEDVLKGELNKQTTIKYTNSIRYKNSLN